MTSAGITWLNGRGEINVSPSNSTRNPVRRLVARNPVGHRGLTNVSTHRSQGVTTQMARADLSTAIFRRAKILGRTGAWYPRIN